MRCAICQNELELSRFDLESVQEGDLVEGKIWLACHHVFHLSCLKKWSQQKEICPIDRSALSKKIIVKLKEKESTFDKIFDIFSEMAGMRVWGEVALRGLSPMP